MGCASLRYILCLHIKKSELPRTDLRGCYIRHLDPVIAEAGEGFGSIIATYKDASGKTFTTKTAMFKVEARVEAEENSELQG